MSLKIPYKKYPDSLSPAGFYYVASLPINIGLSVKNSPRSKRFDAIIDSGASSCVFHASIGRAIGLEIEKGLAALTQGFAGPTKLYLHDISLFVPGGMVATRAGFSDELPIAGLLGMVGFFESFRVTFDPIALQVELDRIHRV